MIKEIIIGIYLILAMILSLLNYYNYNDFFHITLGIIGVIHIFNPKILNEFLLFQWSKFVRLILGILLILIAIKETIL